MKPHRFYATSVPLVPYTSHVLPEPRHDWAAGPFSGHRVFVLLYMTIGILALYALQAWLWPVGGRPHTLFGEVWSWGTVLWTPLPSESNR